MANATTGAAPRRIWIWPLAVAAFALARAALPTSTRARLRRPVRRDDPLSPSITRARREAEAARTSTRRPGFFEAVLQAIPYATVIRDAALQWVAHNDARLGAALSYYSVFSIGPLIVIAIAVAGLFLGQEAVQGQVIDSLRGMLGESGADAISMMLAAANKPRDGTVAIVIGVGTLFLAALGVVTQLKDALNTVWEIKPASGGGVWRFIRTYLLSLAGVMALGFLVLISLLATTALAAIGTLMAPIFPEALGQILGSVVSFAVVTLMFAAMFKWLPDTPVAWRDVWSGAILTAALFEFGKFAIALYIGKQSLESTYGAAASIVVVLIWVYYSAQIVLFGGEFTNVIAKRRGQRRRRHRAVQ